MVGRCFYTFSPFYLKTVDNIVDLNKYRHQNKEYLDFVTHIQKILGVPTNVDELTKTFEYLLCYLEGTVHCFEVLSVLKPMDAEAIEHMKMHVLNKLDSISNDLQKY